MRFPERTKLPQALLALTTALTLTLTLLAAPAPLAADGLTPEDVARTAAVREAAVSPDGRWIAYTVSRPRDPKKDEDGSAWSELYVVGTDGTPRPYVTGDVNVGRIDWTPDGSGISFLAKREGDEERSLYVIPVLGGEAKRVLAHNTAISSYDWNPDGRRVAFVATPDPPKKVEEREKKGFDAEVFEEELRNAQVWIAPTKPPDAHENGDAAEPRALELEGSAASALWSPSGERLAVVIAPTSLVDDALMKQRVEVVDPERGEVVGRVDHQGKLGDVAWSPDSRHLALTAGEDLHDPRAAQLMVVPAEGGIPKKLFPGAGFDVESFAWKDTETLVFVAHEGVESRIQSVGLDGGAPVTHVEAGNPSWERLDLGGSMAALVADSPSYPPELFRWALNGEAGTAMAAKPQRLTDLNPWLADVELAPQEAVRWKARDGLELEGLLIHPLDEKPGQRYPLLVVVHGGPEAHYSNGWLTRYSSPGQMGAAEGYAVFYPNYRGSTGRGLDFAKSSQGDPAGKEFDDVVDGVDHLIATGLVDGDKVGVTGGSYGGYATAWMSTYYTKRFAAGVMFVGISEKIAKWGASDIPNELNWVHDRHWPWEDWDLMWQRSPVRYVEQARTPLLILHGKNDTRVHPSQSLILFRYLKTLGQVPVRLIWYPDEGHGNRKAIHQLDYSLRMLRWFGHYLKGPGGDKPPAQIDFGFPEEEEETPEVSPVTEPGL